MSAPKVFEVYFNLAGKVNSSMRNAFSAAQKQLGQLEERTRGVRSAMDSMSRTTIKTASAMSAVANGLGGITAAAAPAVAGVGALASTFAAAGAGAAAYGVVAASAINKVVEASEDVQKIEEKIKNADSAEARIKAQKELATLYAGMSQNQRDALKNLQGFKSYWEGFVGSFEEPVFQAFAQSLSIAQKGLDLLKPTISNVSVVINEMLSRVNKSLSSGELTGIFDWLTNQVGSSLGALLTTTGQATKGLLNMFVAFAPLTQSVESGMVGMARGFAQWSAGLSSSKGFQSFIEYAKQNTPVLLSVLKNLGGIIVGVIKQVAPLGPAVLSGLNVLTGFISKALNAGIAIKSFGQIVQEAVSGSSGKFEQLRGMVTSVLQNIAPVFKNVAAQAGGLFKSIGSGALQAFSTLYTFWQNNGPAIVEAVSNVFNTVGSVISGVISTVRTIGGVLKPIFQNIASFIMDVATQIMTFWQTNGAQIVQAVQNVFAGISAVIKFLAPVIIPILMMVWDTVKGLIQGALNVIMGVVKVFAGLFTGDFRKMWEGVKQVFIGSIQLVWNYLNLLFIGRILGGIKSLAMKGITPIREMWTKITGFFTGGAQNAWTKIVEMGTKIKTAFNSAKESAINIAKNMWSGVQKHFDDIVSGARSLPGKIGDGIKSMAGKALSGITAMGNKLLSGVGKMVNGVIKGLNWVMGKIGVETKIAAWTVPQYAKGTGGHPGGLAMVNDGSGKHYRELIQFPNGQTSMFEGRNVIANLPKGTQVLSGSQTAALMNNIPAYNSGTLGDTIKSGANALLEKGAAAKDWVADKASDVKDTALDIFSYIGQPSKLLNMALDKFGVALPNLTGNMKSIASGSLNFLKENSLKFLKKKLEGFGAFGGGAVPNVSGGVAGWRPLIIQAARMMGEAITPAQIQGILAQIQRESGGNQRIVQSSAVWDVNTAAGNPARGLLQYIPQTFARYRVKGHNNIYSGFDQLLAFFNNMNWRRDLPYGKRGWGPSGARKYYRGGRTPNGEGWSLVGERGPELLRLPGGTNIFNNRESTGMLSSLINYSKGNQNASTSTNRPVSNQEQVVFAPQINLPAGGTPQEVRQEIDGAMSEAFEMFKRWYAEQQTNKQRLSFAD